GVQTCALPIYNPVLEVSLEKEQEFDIIRLRENIKLGQRIDSVKIEVEEDGRWNILARATSIGSTRLIKLDQLAVARRIRLTIYAPVAPALSDFALYKEFDEDFSFDSEDSQKERLTSTDYKVMRASALSEAIDHEGKLSMKEADAVDEITLKLNSSLSALDYLPSVVNGTKGTVLKYEILVSQDAKKWSSLSIGEFSNIRANPVAQRINMDVDSGSYVKFK